MTHFTNNKRCSETEKMFSYTANGIPILSEIEFPELKTVEGSSNVIIRLGKVPSRIENPIYEGPASQAGKNKYLLNIKNVATYFLEKKDNRFTITVDIVKGVELGEVRIFILSSMFGALAHMHGYLPLHASGVVINGKAILFCGNAGMGKSTISAALYHKGYSFITDNLASIFVNEEGVPMVYPSYSHFRLWKDSLDKLKDLKTPIFKMREAVEKYNLILNERTETKAIPLHKIYHLNHTANNEISIVNSKGRLKADILVNETFRIKLLKSLGSQKNYFELLNQVCAKTEIAKIYRPNNSFLLNELVDQVLNNVTEIKG